VRPDALTSALSHGAEGSPQNNTSTDDPLSLEGEGRGEGGTYGSGGHSVHFMFLATL